MDPLRGRARARWTRICGTVLILRPGDLLLKLMHSSAGAPTEVLNRQLIESGSEMLQHSVNELYRPDAATGGVPTAKVGIVVMLYARQVVMGGPTNRC